MPGEVPETDPAIVAAFARSGINPSSCKCTGLVLNEVTSSGGAVNIGGAAIVDLTPKHLAPLGLSIAIEAAGNVVTPLPTGKHGNVNLDGSVMTKIRIPIR